MPGEEQNQKTEVSFTRSAEIGKLVGAMCKAQLAFDPIYKESENPAFKRGNRVSKYADLYSLVTATRKHLNNNGITVMQFPDVVMDGKVLAVTTLVAHESGEWISCRMNIPAVDERGFTAHSIGKAMTYARRYSWQAVTGSIAEDDDDGNDASGQGTHEAAQAVGQAKVEELRKSSQRGSKAQETPSEGASLFYALQPGGFYAVTGDSALMERLYKQFKPQRFIDKDGPFYKLNDDQLNVLQFECKEGNIPLSQLKGPKS